MTTLAPASADRTPARTPAAAAQRQTVVVPQPVQSWEIGGKRLYRTMQGKIIELPPEVTAEEAALLEAEALAAEKRLGKLPPPQPVPDVRKPAPKPAKTQPPRPRTRARRGAGKPPLKPADAAAALLKAVGGSRVAQYLAARGAPIFARGAAMLSHLKRNEQTHDDAGEKLKKSEDAVVIPPSEDQSKGNAGQVSVVGGRREPVVDENKGKRELDQSLDTNVPRTIEAVDNFKRDKKAQHTSADVMDVVQVDKNAVIGTFGDVRVTPLPVPSVHTRVDLPPIEKAPPTPFMNLGRGAIAPLQKEHTDLSAYTKEADARLKEEGVTQEQLDMVDSGELAAANKEKKGMAQRAASEPLAVQRLAQQETERVDRDLAQEERGGRSVLEGRRKAALGATAEKQERTKTALEKKREQVAAEINNRYKTAQDSVTKKLAELETQSMKRFEEGNAAAAKDFEDNVQRELAVYKADRYSGWFGWARKAKDWLLGMDDLPRVKEIFERNRKAFVDRINKLVEDIAAENKRVIQECKDELTAAKEKIQEYVDGLEPGLKEIGKTAAGEMDDKLNGLDTLIGKKEEELQNKLKDKQTAAIRAIDEKIEKMKEAMSGALAKLGRLLLWAAKKFFTWALEKFGFSLSTIENVINKGTAVLKAIFTGPIQFVKNLIGAAKEGFSSFGKNFLTHLKDAVFEWLTGSLQGVTLPATWNLRGIVSVMFQLIGISWENVKARLLTMLPAPVVQGLETGFELVQTLRKEGPMAAWEQIKDIAGEMRTSFEDAVRNWIKWKVVEEAIKTVLAIFVPGAGIIRAVIAIYDTIVFFIQRAKDIIRMVGNFLSSIADIAAGNIAAAAAALEEGLARGLKLVIDFLARFLRLSGITAKIREVIQSIRTKVDAVIDKVAKWIIGMAQKAGKFAVGTARKAAGAVLQWWKRRVGFKTAEGKEHSISIESDAPGADLVVESAPTYLGVLVGKITNAEKKRKAQSKQRQIVDVINAGRQDKDEAAVKARSKELDSTLKEMGDILVEAKVLDAQVLPVATYDFQSDGGRAKKATVKKLSAMRQWGSVPGSAKPVGWEYVQAIGKSTSTPLFRRLHLINERFGGPGMNSNLAVASKTDNENHLYNVENPIKELVGDKPNEQEKTIVVDEYSVTVEYGRKNKNLAYKGASAKLSDFPTKFHCAWKYKDDKGASKNLSKDIDFPTPDSELEK